MLNTDRPTGTLSMRRVLALFVTMAVIFGIFSVRLFKVQIIDGEEYANLAEAGTKTTISISASRGEILDRNQIPLVSNRTSYAVVLDYNYFPHADLKDQNDCLLSLVKLLQEQGEEWNDTLPISVTTPYAFSEDRESGVTRLKNYLRMASYATADNCMGQMIELYELEEYTAEEQRCLAGIHYNMSVAGFGQRTPYTFAGDITSETMYRIMENNARFPGVDVSTVPVREYVSGETACHIIGSVGPIYAEEYEALAEKGYSYNDIVGKSGIEAAAETYLRGKDGARVLVKNSSGTVTSEEETIAPTPGQTVILSIDSKLQQTAQDAMDKKIKDLRATAAQGKGKDVKSGSVVMLDVTNGGVMVCASWPSYDLSTYTENYNELVSNEDNPLFNRALYGAFACGSTFKPGVALAAITDGKISPTATIDCTRTYMYYAPSYTPNCMGLHRHLSVVGALEKSCNYYFYDVGRLMGSNLFSYLSLYGFGQRTGVEIGETTGVQQTPESLQAIGSTWVPGDYLQLAIGQRGSYTPIQLAAYTMMIANNGVRYKTHFIHSVRSFDSASDTVIQPEVAASVDWSEEAMQYVKKGMVAVGKSGTASSYFASAGYTIACKTGTAQTGIANSSDHGAFIAYAPADDPEVAIAVVMERGTSSASTAVAKEVLNAYFANKEMGEPPTDYGVILP